MFSLIPANRRKDIFAYPSVIDRFFKDPFFSTFDETVEATANWIPAVEVSESDDELSFIVELPGLSQNDLRLNVENQVLTFSGERLDEQKEGLDCLRSERRYGKFSRSFRLPATADVEKVSAAMKDGILTIRVPKKAEARKKKIEVKVH